MIFKPKTCHYCRNIFEPLNRQQVYCSLECRFWSKVKKLGPDDCWNWIAKTTPGGYGQFRYKGPLTHAHRVARILTHGPIPENLFTLHHCDNRPCCNPSHLFLGTHADNMADMIKKGRQPPRYGENSGCAKLTDEQVKIIKQELAKGILHRLIAKKYGVKQQAISKIKTGRRWAHI